MPVSRKNYSRFARRFNPGYFSAANTAARRAYTASWFSRAGSVAGVVGAVGAAAVANLATRVPRLDTRPDMPSRLNPFLGGPAHKKRKVVQDASGYVQLTRLPFATVGKQLSRQEMLNKHVEAQMFKRIDRWQKMSGAGTVNGNFWLSYVQDAAAGSVTKYFYPCYTFDLTSLSENVAVDSTGLAATVASQPFMRLSRVIKSGVTPVTNYYEWDVQSCVGNNGSTTTTQWQNERVPYLAGSLANLPYSKALLHEADIKLQLWGAKQFPSSVEVSLVRFTDENVGPPSKELLNATQKILHPIPAVPTAADAGGTNDFAQYEKFWSSQMDRFVGTPMNTRYQSKDSKGMQVLWSKRVDLNPTAQYENDTTGHQYTLQLRYIMDMIGSYNHYNANDAFGDGYNGEVSWTDPNVWPATIDYKDTHACLRNKSSRVFLLIRGLATTILTNGVGTGNANENASFDIMVRRSVTLI